MKVSSTQTILAGLLLSATMNSPVLAAQHKPATMTCEEFLAVDDVVQPKVVYWNDGFIDNEGKWVDPVVDIEETDQLIPVLITECQKNPKVSMKEKLKEIKGSKAK
ncbi:MAG: HdeA/HdeB family chaperone [Methylomonas lenta]|nr:HdeA/HdeB family chaperone [Methylomonas lenta]